MKRSIMENAQFVISSIEGLGIALNPNSRLKRMSQVLSRGYIPLDDPDIEIALEGLRDSTLLAFVFDNLNARADDSRVRDIVKRVIKDSILPQDDRQDSKGRNAQFELFVAAICQSAGLTPVDFEEPDVTCVIEKTKYGIAAKRIKSENALERRIREASKQIKTTGFPGIIALDTCLAFNPDNERIWRMIPDRIFARLYSNAINNFVHRHHDRMQEGVRGKNVRGIVIHDNQVRLDINNQWAPESMTFWIPTAQDDNQGDREFCSFRDNYLRGLPNLEYL